MTKKAAVPAKKTAPTTKPSAKKSTTTTKKLAPVARVATSAAGKKKTTTPAPASGPVASLDIPTMAQRDAATSPKGPKTRSVAASEIAAHPTKSLRAADYVDATPAKGKGKSTPRVSVTITPGPVVKLTGADSVASRVAAKGVDAATAPAPAEKRAKRETKYVDHGPDAPHRYTGTMHTGAKLRTDAAGCALFIQRVGSDAWVQVYDATQNRYRDINDIMRACQAAAKQNLDTPPAKLARGEGAPRTPRASSSRRASRNSGTRSSARAAAEYKPIPSSCEFPSVVGFHRPCTATLDKRVTRTDGAVFYVCTAHAAKLAATACERWEGATVEAFETTPSAADAAEVTA